ncbi:DNA-binding protein D-ETS-3-like [Anopheles nili]|uniref:DNA-binding protein D-ETS-3-like n=1 Tax=Anopheles nili TaxID=185578 RepID=UPI00237C40E9|nr:DNA-binding protein D-ETS-3-like [Anopheles nili]
MRVKRKYGSKMYESSCSYQTALDLKRGASPLVTHQVKSEDCLGLTQCTDWGTYRFHQSTFEQLKQSVEKAKAALQDRTSFLGSSSAFSDIYSSPRLTESLENVITHSTGNNSSTGNTNNGTGGSNPAPNGSTNAESNPANNNASGNASNATSTLNVSGGSAGSSAGNGAPPSSGGGSAGGGGGGGTGAGAGGGGSSSISVINATSLVSPANLLGNGLSGQRHRGDLLGAANLNLVSSTQSPTTTSTPSSILSQNLESPVDVKSRQGKSLLLCVSSKIYVVESFSQYLCSSSSFFHQHTQFIPKLIEPH